MIQKKKQKIIVNCRFLTQKTTGVQRFAIEICKRLPSTIKGKEIIYVAPKGGGENKIGANIVQLGRFNGQLWEQIDLPRYLKKHDNPVLINLVGIAPVFYKNKIMVLHDLAFKHHPEWFNFYFNKAYNFLIPKSLKHSKFLITVSNYVKEDIIKTYQYQKEQIQVVYNAPAEIFINKNIKKEKIILTVSSIEPRKNLKRVIEAFTSIDSDYKLIVVGSKHQSFSNLGLDDLESNDNVIFTGYLSDEALIKLYNTAEIFIYASLFEGFGIPPLEAQASGCPCVISNTTCLPEIYKDTVSYCDPLSVKSIKTSLLDLILNENKRVSLKQKGIKNAERFSWDISAKNFVKIIEEFS